MKTTFTLFALLFACVLNIQPAQAQIEMPTYVLDVANMTLNSPYDNELQFDIYIRRTSQCPLIYLMGRYEFFFNPLIANGGNLTYSFVPGFSDLPGCFQPQNASISGNMLIMQYNSFFNSAVSEELPVTDGFPGTRICRMKLQTSAPFFASDHLCLRWNNPGSGGISPVTRIYALVGFFIRQITTPPTHAVDSTGFNGALPVELASFTSSVNKNSVTLNWTTSNELNNSGFDIERKIGNNEWTRIGFVNGNGTTNNSVSYVFSDRSLSTANYNYRLKQIDFNGSYQYYNLSSEVNIGIPNKFNLSQNYPNPFNPTTTINYEIPADGKVTLKLYDVSGKVIKEFINEFKPAGYYSLQINGSDLSSGTYFYRISSDGSQNFTSTKKMILMK